MNKEKEIEEMVEIARKHGQKIFQETEMYADIYDDMTAVYEAGYRKADEVRKETAREILEYLRAVQEKDELKNCDLDWIAMQYGVEVDE